MIEPQTMAKITQARASATSIKLSADQDIVLTAGQKIISLGGAQVRDGQQVNILP